MFSNSVRLLVGVFTLAAALMLAYFELYILAIFLVILMLYMIWSYFKQGTVALAAKYYKNKDYQKTEILLSQIKNPDRLLVKRRGFYEFMKANIALKNNQIDQAEYHFQVASAFPLHTENDKAYVLIHLANINLRKGEREKVKAYLLKAKQMKVSSRVQELIKKIEKEANAS